MREAKFLSKRKSSGYVINYNFLEVIVGEIRKISPFQLYRVWHWRSSISTSLYESRITLIVITSFRVFADDSNMSSPKPIEMSCRVRSSSCKTICLREEFIFLLTAKLTEIFHRIQEILSVFFIPAYRKAMQLLCLLYLLYQTCHFNRAFSCVTTLVPSFRTGTLNCLFKCVCS